MSTSTTSRRAPGPDDVMETDSPAGGGAERYARVLTLAELLEAAKIPPARSTDAIKATGLAGGDDSTTEQRDRVRTAPKGLRGKALGIYILTGKTGTQQVADAANATPGARKAPTAGKAPAAAKAASGKPRGGKASGKAKPATPSPPTTADAQGPRAPREGSGLHAAITILADASEAMTPQAIYDLAVQRGLGTGLKGKTPVATLGAQMAVATKKGLYFERPQPGRYTRKAA